MTESNNETRLEQSKEQPNQNTLQDTGGRVWRVDNNDTADCIDCDGVALQILELDSDRYICQNCGVVWNPQKIA